MINETFSHSESGVFRAVTGGAYNFPNSYGDIAIGSSFPRKGTIPIANTWPGTFKTGGKCVRGTSTEFTKLLVGSYLYDGSVLRQIDYILSDTMMFLKQAFPSDVSVAAAVKICERQFFKLIVCDSTHATESAILQEAPFRPGIKFFDGGSPVSYDASSAGEVSFSAHQ